jgi:autotransporter-associated beta strand protein
MLQHNTASRRNIEAIVMLKHNLRTFDGRGKLVLTQNVAYTGDTDVEDGTLVVPGVSNGEATIVGTATTTAELITGQVRQDALTINAGSTATISTAGGAGGTSVVNFLYIANGTGGFSWGDGESATGVASYNRTESATGVASYNRTESATGVASYNRTESATGVASYSNSSATGVASYSNASATGFASHNESGAAPVPEPAKWWLLAVAAIAMLWSFHRK